MGGVQKGLGIIFRMTNIYESNEKTKHSNQNYGDKYSRVMYVDKK